MKPFLIAAALLQFWITATAGAQDMAIVIQERRPQSWDQWTGSTGHDLLVIKDDDIQRHANNAAYFADLQIDEWYIRENGFDWHLIRFTNIIKPAGPLWLVPHDDENAAFESMIDAIRRYGGVGIAINSGQGSVRNQSGRGTCGGRVPRTQSCDPNRNFSKAAPLFTKAILDQHLSGQPIIALHTNMPGYGKGRGDISILDAKAALKGKRQPRKDGYFGIGSGALLRDPDVYAILPYAAQNGISSDAHTCRTRLNAKGVNVWHERVGTSDGSLSNYIALQRPDINYVNAEAKREIDLTQATAAHGLMVDAYLMGCFTTQ
jgi:hypothetical protein